MIRYILENELAKLGVNKTCKDISWRKKLKKEKTRRNSSSENMTTFLIIFYVGKQT